MQRRRRIFAVAFLASGIILASRGCGISASAPDKLSGYAYEDTRRLVALVEEAAKLMEEKGESALRYVRLEAYESPAFAPRLRGGATA
jgi:hypothetical protein